MGVTQGGHDQHPRCACYRRRFAEACHRRSLVNSSRKRLDSAAPAESTRRPSDRRSALGSRHQPAEQGYQVAVHDRLPITRPALRPSETPLRRKDARALSTLPLSDVERLAVARIAVEINVVTETICYFRGDAGDLLSLHPISLIVARATTTQTRGCLTTPVAAKPPPLPPAFLAGRRGRGWFRSRRWRR
ncbi:MAG: hypothetical protein QOE68_3686 [Thermoanaerobaculia bacterium]|nr:hypothetical protein [Thermoanaerobaculia bacterium]